MPGVPAGSTTALAATDSGVGLALSGDFGSATAFEAGASGAGQTLSGGSASAAGAMAFAASDSGAGLALPGDLSSPAGHTLSGVSASSAGSTAGNSGTGGSRGDFGASSASAGHAIPPATSAPALLGPQTVVEAVHALASRPDATIIAGGTAAMPEINAGRRHVSALLTLHRCTELRGYSAAPGEVLLHAGLTLTEMQRQELRAQVPALAQAARTIGSPHIRSQATLGGNLVVGPASADLPVVLAALGASVLVASTSGVRSLSVFDFYDRDGRPQITPGELVIGARVPVVRGMQGFMKIGVRGGTTRPILSITLAVDPSRRSATCVVGATAVASLPGGPGRGGFPALLRADHADRWLADQVDWDAGAIPDPAVYETFGRLVAESLMYGDGAGTLGGAGDPYRRKAAEICARRALLRALPPLGWLDQVRELQQRADFQRAKARVERAEREKEDGPQ